MLMGNLTRDPELRYTPGGAAVCELGLAMNRKYQKGEEWVEETTFVDITVWGRQGETAAQYLSKGSPAFIEGRLKLDQWETKEGQKRSKLSVVASRVQFLGSGGGEGSGQGGTRRGGQGGAPRGGVQRTRPSGVQRGGAPKQADDDMSLDDVPF